MANTKSQTKINNELVTEVPIAGRRSVTYIFKITTTKNLKMPYVVAIDGTVGSDFALRPKIIGCDNSKIVVRNLNRGQKVALHLNSDASLENRKMPVYKVEIGDNDVIVQIEEKTGKINESDTPVRSASDANRTSPDIDVYRAVLTGDIWMRISHRYESREVERYITPDIPSPVVNGVRKIYAGLKEPWLEIEMPQSVQDTVPNKVRIEFNDSENAKRNIRIGYDLLTEGIRRVHPAGFLSIFSAALESGVRRINISSTWRPMEGSIVHRAGLGLDVNYINSTRLNREELREARAVDTPNVSTKEKELFAAYEEAKSNELSAISSLAAVKKDLGESAHDITTAALVQQKHREAKDALSKARDARKEAEVRWSMERDSNEPIEIKKFRSALIKNSRVIQVLDPWLMDVDTHDRTPAAPNFQRNPNEELHAHHLHVTVNEPNIL